MQDIKPEKAMAPHSSTLAQKIPWVEEPGRLQSMGSLESDTTEATQQQQQQQDIKLRGNTGQHLQHSGLYVPQYILVFIPIPKKGDAKECSNYCTIALISHTSKVMLKILQAMFQQYVNRELPDIQAGFRKGRRTRDQIANIDGSSKMQDSFRKTSISALLTMPKPLTVWITINCGKF